MPTIVGGAAGGAARTLQHAVIPHALAGGHAEVGFAGRTHVVVLMCVEEPVDTDLADCSDATHCMSAHRAVQSQHTVQLLHVCMQVLVVVASLKYPSHSGQIKCLLKSRTRYSTCATVGRKRTCQPRAHHWHSHRHHCRHGGRPSPSRRCDPRPTTRCCCRRCRATPRRRSPRQSRRRRYRPRRRCRHHRLRPTPRCPSHYRRRRGAPS